MLYIFITFPRDTFHFWFSQIQTFYGAHKNTSIPHPSPIGIKWMSQLVEGVPINGSFVDYSTLYKRCEKNCLKINVNVYEVLYIQKL